MLPALIFALNACSAPKTSDDIIPEDTYIDLLVELHILSAIEHTYPDSTLRDETMENVLSKYNISAETIERSHEYYLQNVEAQHARLEEANRRVKEEFERFDKISKEREAKRNAK